MILPRKFIASRVLVSAGVANEAEAYLESITARRGSWNLLYAAIAESRGDHEQALVRLADGHGPEIFQL